MARTLARARGRSRGHREHQARVRHRAATAQHHRRAAHGSRIDVLHPGHAVPPAADARVRGRVVPGDRPRRDRDAERHRAPARRRGHDQGGAWPSSVSAARRRLVQGVRRPHLRADAADGVHVRLGAITVHPRQLRTSVPSGWCSRRCSTRGWSTAGPRIVNWCPRCRLRHQRRGDRLAGAHRRALLPQVSG